MMKKLKVNFWDIASVMESYDDMEQLHRFDTETGEVVCIPDEVMRAIESNDKDELEDLPDWEKELIQTAEDISVNDGERYVEILTKPSYEGYNLMVEFASTVNDQSLKEKLDIALDGKGAFRRFKNVLYDYPEEKERWFACKNEKMKQEIADWLNGLGIEPVSKYPV